MHVMDALRERLLPPLRTPAAAKDAAQVADFTRHPPTSQAHPPLPLPALPFLDHAPLRLHSSRASSSSSSSFFRPVRPLRPRRRHLAPIRPPIFPIRTPTQPLHTVPPQRSDPVQPVAV